MQPAHSLQVTPSSEQEAVHALYTTLKRLTPAVLRDNRLPCPPAFTAEATSPLCGSRVVLDAEIVDGQVLRLGHQVRACSLGQAVTAVIKQHVPELDAATTARVRTQLAHLLHDGAGTCDWPELEVFAQAHALPARHASALLPFDALLTLFHMAAQDGGLPPAMETAHITVTQETPDG